jgi:hypothetical protein
MVYVVRVTLLMLINAQAYANVCHISVFRTEVFLTVCALRLFFELGYVISDNKIDLTI